LYKIVVRCNSDQFDFYMSSYAIYTGHALMLIYINSVHIAHHLYLNSNVIGLGRFSSPTTSFGSSACTACSRASGAPAISNSFQPGAIVSNRLFVCLNILNPFLVERIPSKTITSLVLVVPLYAHSSPVVRLRIRKFSLLPLYVIFKK